jgi:hypothetical protein
LNFKGLVVVVVQEYAVGPKIVSKSQQFEALQRKVGDFIVISLLPVFLSTVPLPKRRSEEYSRRLV